MDLFELIADRESCRNYNYDKKVSCEQLEKCVNAARLAPSACNSQPWHFYVAQSEQSCEKIRQALQRDGANKFTDNVTSFICVAQTSAKLTDRVEKSFSSDYFVNYDIGIAVAHILLEAKQQGLSSCVIGWLDEQKLAKALNLPPEQSVHLVVAIGYSTDDSRRKKSRKSFEETVDFI